MYRSSWLILLSCPKVQCFMLFLLRLYYSLTQLIGGQDKSLMSLMSALDAMKCT